MNSVRIDIIGAGVAGLCTAKHFIDRGCHVSLYAQSMGIDESCCSWWAGGMLAPWCESESAEPLITRLGQEGLTFWSTHSPELRANGSLVVAQTRDRIELEQFAKRTTHHESVSATDIDRMEPDLAGRFTHGLYFDQESHLDPREALQSLLSSLQDSTLFDLHQGQHLDAHQRQPTPKAQWLIDCRGLAASDELTDLRGVKGEMLILESKDVTLNRPVRLLHPRYPIYIVPRKSHQFMVGATMIESDDKRYASARSVMELLSSAYALHPAFAEAALVEVGTDVRPAFMDNLPRIRRRGRTVYVNGLYRHGFLCAPALASRCVALTLDGIVDNEVVDENTD